MSEPESPPTVFISYSHDSPAHKRWVLELAGELREKGVEVIIDAWDLRPGDDVPKFMERGVRDSDRVLMICTEKYVAKANDGIGGVGYEATIVTGELVRDLGSAKFIPIIRQNTEFPDVPTSVSTRRYINLSEGSDRPGEIDTLLRDLHGVAPDKPPLGRSPFAAVVAAPARDNPDRPIAPTSGSDELARDPADVYREALDVALSGNMLGWRRIVAAARRAMKPALKTWLDEYGQSHPGVIDTLIEQSMEGVAAFVPLAAIALGGVASGRPKFSNQIGLLEDILNPTEWQRGGLVIRVELPETGAFVYQALLGAMALHVGNVRLAIELARSGTSNRTTGKTMPLWQRHDLIAWPQSLGKTATKAWQVVLGLAARWPWIAQVFADETDYQAALYAYYVTLSFIEYVESVRAQTDIPEDPVRAHWWPDVPVFFELTDDDIKRRGYQLVIAEKEALRAWLAEVKVDQKQLTRLWPRWISVQRRILAQERPFSHDGLAFERLVDDLFDR